MSVFVLALALLGQGKKAVHLEDVHQPTVFEEKIYVVKGDLLIAAPATFAEGAIVYLPGGATVRLLADVTCAGDPKKAVTFVAEKGRPWKGLAVDGPATLTGVRVLGAETGVLVAKNTPVALTGCSLLKCNIGVKVLRNDGYRAAAPSQGKAAAGGRPCRIENCWIAGCRAQGVYLDDLTSVDLERCTVHDCLEGLFLRYSGNVDASRCVFAGCRMAVKSQWQENRLRIAQSAFENNALAVYHGARLDLDLKGNFWAGAPKIAYDPKGRDVGRVDFSAPLGKAPKEAGADVVLKRLPNYR